jgi:hypothetical protein
MRHLKDGVTQHTHVRIAVVFIVYHKRTLMTFRVLCRLLVSLERNTSRSGDVRGHLSIPDLEQIVANRGGDEEIRNQSDRQPCQEHPVRVLAELQPLRISRPRRVSAR